MADEDEEGGKEGGEDKAEGGGSKKKIIILAVLGLLLVGISVGGTVAVLSFMTPEAIVEEEMPSEEEMAEIPEAPAIYYPLKPPYRLNIDARGRRRYLQLEVTLMTRDEDVIASIEMHRATIDNAVNLIGGGQIFEDIQTPEGKEFLRLQLLEEIQKFMQEELGKDGIAQVLFTNFVMQ